MGHHKILFPTDFSAASQFALPYAVAQASMANATLLIVHVQEDAAAAGEGALHHAYDDPRGDLDAVEVEGFAGAVERHLLEGRPPQELVRFADEQAVDLIVMGMHGHTGLSRAFMGSVAEQVLRRAKCPVLTIRMQKS